MEIVHTEAIIMFKPDARDVTFANLRTPRLLHEVGANLLVACGLEIEQYSQMMLSETQIRTIYEKALAPDPEDDAVWGTEWKDEVVKHISSAPIDAYLLKDPANVGIEIVRDLKNWMRKYYGRQGNVVQNIAHVPDLDEIAAAKSILFSHE